MHESRVDLHVHSKYSDRPTEWVLRRIGAPECYTPPRAVYDAARRRGMDFVTITDHNSIDGVTEIAHLPGVFVSSEITTYFPDDGCKVHVLCWNLTPAQFGEIDRLRENIVDLRDYLWQEQIPHSCAHPLYNINDRLTIAHIERLIVLFNVFETMNGGRNRRGNDLVTAILAGLRREDFEDMANRQRITPVGKSPWIKGVTGGSDDHSGVFVAKGFTICPKSATIDEFLQHVAGRRGRAGGLDGTPLSFAHSLYRIAYQYYRDRFLPGSSDRQIPRMLGAFFGPSQGPSGLRDRVSLYAKRIRRRPEEAAEIEFKRLVSNEMVALFGQDWLADDIVATPEQYEAINRRTFELSSRIANQLLFQFSKRFADKLSAGSIFGSLEALSAAGPILLGVAPYLFSFAHQSRDKQFLADVSRHFLHTTAPLGTAPRKAWFVDALTDVSGATRLVQVMCRIAAQHDHDLTLVSCADGGVNPEGRVQKFRPVGRFALPDDESVTLGFPPFLDVLDYCDRRQLTEIIVSTPSLTGLAAVAAAKILKLRLVGVYDTDLPQYIRHYTEDEAVEDAAWKYLRWFYEQMDLVYVLSRASLDRLVAKGLDPATLHLLPRGVDAVEFHPRHRRPGFWTRYGASTRALTVTYAGRVAKDKDLDVLADVYDLLAARRPDCTFAVVGDGPFLVAMRARLHHYPNVVFTGLLSGGELSAAYATSDICVFPGTSDTFGSAVLEAMASGVPVIVSESSGLAEIVEDGVSGLVTKGRSVAAMATAIERLLDEAATRRQLADTGRARAEACGWERIYLDVWRGVERARLTAGAI